MRISIINYLDYFELNNGAAYVISSIAKSRHIPSLIDISLHKRTPLKYVLSEIKRNSPQVIGFSTMNSHFVRNLDLAKNIKAQFPGIFIVFGGIHPSLCPEETLASPYVDAVCIGEGEKAVIELLDCLEQKKEINVKGVWYKTDGRIIKNELRNWEQDLDSLPFPDWSFWELDAYFERQPAMYGALSIITSRGCNFNCSFCCSKTLAQQISGGYFRVRSAENIISEVKYNKLKYRNFNFLIINDAIFGINKMQFQAFIRLYKKEGLNKIIPWKCQTRADVITQGWARDAKEGGCVLVQLGLEHGIEDYRMRIYNKGITDKQFVNAVNDLRRAGILYNLNVIIGGPGESLKDTITGLKFAYSLKPMYLHIEIFTALPKTDIERIITKKPLRKKNGPSLYLIRLTLLLYRISKMLFIGVRMHGVNFFIKFFVKLIGPDKKNKITVNSFFLVGIERIMIEEKLKRENL